LITVVVPPTKPTLTQLTITTTPPDAKVRVLNVKEKYQDGMLIRPGDAEVEVTADGYEEHVAFYKVNQGEHAKWHIELKKLPPPPPVKQRIPTLVETDRFKVNVDGDWEKLETKNPDENVRNYFAFRHLDLSSAYLTMWTAHHLENEAPYNTLTRDGAARHLSPEQIGNDQLKVLQLARDRFGQDIKDESVVTVDKTKVGGVPGYRVVLAFNSKDKPRMKVMYMTYHLGVWTYLNLEFSADDADELVQEAARINEKFVVKD
jgi:hypothetical protein